MSAPPTVARAQWPCTHAVLAPPACARPATSHLRLGSPPLPSPPRTPRSCPIRTTRPARQPVGLRRSLAAPLAATFEVAADGAANERVGPKRRRVFTIPEPYLSAGIFNATRGRSRPPPPPRRPPFTAASAAISAPIITATPLATTAPECATIDAILASMTTLSRRPARAGPTWHRHHRLHRRFPRPAAAAAVTPVAAIAPATILAATAGAAERCDVWEGLLALPPPQCKKKKWAYNGHLVGPTVELEGHLWCYRPSITMEKNHL